jgi:hypothetical protein
MRIRDTGFRQMVRGRFEQSDRRLDVQQAVDHRLGPVLLVLLMRED